MPFLRERDNITIGISGNISLSIKNTKSFSFFIYIFYLCSKREQISINELHDPSTY